MWLLHTWDLTHGGGGVHTVSSTVGCIVPEMTGRITKQWCVQMSMSDGPRDQTSLTSHL